MANHLQEVIARIEKARIAYSRHQIIKLVAISKYWEDSQIIDLYQSGQRAFGENKVQDLKRKALDLDRYPLEWHFVGNLQENKINTLISLKPALIHSIDSLKIAKALQMRLEREGLRQKALMQINSAKEETKGGVAPEEAYELYHRIQEECPNLIMEGVMTIGAHTEDPNKIKESFETTQKIYETLPNAKILSMGMSRDFELAIACGANLLRIGSALMG
ncbi:YggS family pyridoxal phosphate-dependent enzyme [Helicobacter pametensis]|uniref:YggS family pyridoxal phosphate-dependent enzyme n=1 Tax=Helicobacter pametensis TaxID=95149 RepID=UPI000484D1B6|nr:YggS family pyridoxal phosphate-dependent enzyme [Helicobacter pametensis]